MPLSDRYDTDPRPSRIRAAAVQMDVRLGDVEGNLARVLDRLQAAASKGANLVVFPEACLSGYCFGNLDEAKPSLLAAESEAVREFCNACARLNVTGVLGFLEGGCDAPPHAPPFSMAYNSAILASPGPQPGVPERELYRKTHLPTLGIDRFVQAGGTLTPPFASPAGSIGMLICYDVRFPEAARVLGLQGADVLALPTNWPEGAESSPDLITKARAWENRFWVVAANRVGVERGRRFIGRSQIVSPTGVVVQEAGGDEECIVMADLDLTLARQKRIINEPGEWELDITQDRRPELYRALVD